MSCQKEKNAILINPDYILQAINSTYKDSGTMALELDLWGHHEIEKM